MEEALDIMALTLGLHTTPAYYPLKRRSNAARILCPEMRIESRHSFYSCAAHDELLAAWEAARSNSGPLELDLSAASFFDPYGLVALTVFLCSLPDAALPVALKMNGFPLAKGEKPSERGAVAYLTEMGFWEDVGGKLAVPHALLPVRPQFSDDKNVLIDLTLMHTRDAVGVMLRKTGELLQNLGFPPAAKMHVQQVLSELSGNVLDHAQSELGGVLASQIYRSTRSGVRYLVLSIGDAGIGVRASLSQNQKLAARLDSDATALGVAVQRGNSRFASERGLGLSSVLDIAKRYGGSVAMRSGKGALAYRGEDDRRRVFDAPPQIGTQLRIMLPENRLRD